MHSDIATDNIYPRAQSHTYVRWHVRSRTIRRQATGSERHFSSVNGESEEEERKNTTPFIILVWHQFVNTVAMTDSKNVTFLVDSQRHRSRDNAFGESAITVCYL